MAYKWPRILALVDALPARRWILFGDSGESDPEVYRRLMDQRTGHVRAVYIHIVTDEPADDPRFRGMIPFHEWKEAAADLRTRGLTGASN